ncbi:MDR family MFS transporter [Dehalococcoides mccartyi]|uniref:Major facilitator family transporter n=1 Tax=Dehalococcoides mccartyi TaxID=61435 RepID=A0A142VAQ5_9CHLR|nr:MFS transporter [Dehalococcoides mccartyi]AII61059.1 MFS transporter [Dehalococcoides mccartyi CG5]AMU86739.1 major facilitator family transporter [Dehalococcoides mccartyi]AOV99507.1 multidrug-efflux transporter related protein [Dehalococcoides mccartyi]MBA2085307.1 putative MFS-type transporter [Dehalococcoides mccartyi]QBX64014.1 MFS transporter [Dehalococcoides mccartyi]
MNLLWFSPSYLKARIKTGLIDRFDRGVWMLTLIGLINSAAFSLSLPFISLYLYQERGLSMTQVGLVILLSGFVSAIVQMVAGALADTYGRKPVMLLTTVGSAVIYGAMAVLIGFNMPVMLIILSYVLLRCTLVATRPASQAMIADLTPKDRLTETYGMVRIGNNLGWAIGPMLGGFLLIGLPYAYLFGVGAVVCLITLYITAKYINESLSNSVEWVSLTKIFSAGKDRAFLWFTILSILLFIVVGQFISTLSVFTVDRLHFSEADYGMLLTLNGLMVFALQYPVTRILHNVSKSHVVVMGSLIYAVGYLMFAWTTNLGMAFLAMSVITMGEIVFAPTTLAVVGDLSPPQQRGRYMGFYGFSEMLGFSLGPMVGGALLDAHPDSSLSVWGTLAALAVMSAVGFYIWGRVVRKTVSLNGQSLSRY